MSAVVIYSPTDPTVVGRVNSYLLSVNTPDYESNPDALINPNLSGVTGTDQKYWKVVNGLVVVMTNQEKKDIDNFLLAKTNREKKFQVVTYGSQGHPMNETWYDTTDGAGNYSGMAEVTAYTYDVNVLLYMTVATYYYDGTIQVAYRHSYFKNDAGQTIEKIEEI